MNIDDPDFDKHFFDAKRHSPKRGQILAKFTAWAVYEGGPAKQNMIKLLRLGKIQAAIAVMQKIHHARVEDSYRVCREMSQDLLNGMTDEEVELKEYEFVLEMLYYTERCYVPNNDPHWSTIDLLFSPNAPIPPLETTEISENAS